MEWYNKIRRRASKKYRVIYKRGPSVVAAVFAGMALASWAVFALLSSYPVLAYVYYTLAPATSNLLSRSLFETAQGSVKADVWETEETAELERVPKDVSLPEGHYLTIRRIGVDTVIWEGDYSEYERVLRHGVWRVPDFPKPNEYGGGKPVIMAAHRFGYLEWTQEYRLKNSFYDLPKLKVGDEIEIMWDQRRYVYQVTRVEEGTEITDYSGDLILYTCKFLVSPVRIFVYASLVL